MIGFAPPLALDISQVIWLIIVVLFIVIPAIGQLIAKMGQPQPPRGGRLPRRPPAGPGGGPAAGPPRAAGLEDEIGEFLRRAAQRRQAQAAPAPRPGAPPPVAQAVGQQIVEAEVVRPPLLGEGIKQQVGEHLDAGEFRRRTAQLGEEVTRADQQVQQRLHARFDHEVSRLAGTPGESAAGSRVAESEEAEDHVTELPSTAAAGLAAMLTNPESVRQAIVINEILTRPERRWT